MLPQRAFFLLTCCIVTITCTCLAEEATQSNREYVQISGIYPHLAVFNQPEDPADRPKHGECGIGAIAVWADRLWYLTYPQHKTMGSNDKLYELDAEMRVRIRPESVGGTHACRMIHRESQQLILGPYFIDANRNVRVVDLKQLRGRMTAVMRHLTDPANKVYYFDMEGAIYEVDVHTLAVKRLFDKPVPGWHGKGGYTAQGRVVIANNGEVGPADGYRKLLVGGPAQGEEAGVLAEWDGSNWRIVERRQFCDVTGPGGIEGSLDENSPLWAIGWDKRSVILKLLDGGRWFTFRLPKGSHTFDPRHGWFTEWPRIREVAPGRFMMCMHGQMFDFPPTFCDANRGGIRPICTHLRYIPDFCHWNGRVVLGADDASMMQNQMCGQGQSNLWFGMLEDLHQFGPATGWGGVWMGDAIQAETPSDPFLFAGYRQRVVHISQQSQAPVVFQFEVDRTGRQEWQPLCEVEVPPDEYRYKIFPEDAGGEWIRVRPSAACRATVYFHYWSPRQGPAQERAIFDGLAEVSSHASEPLYAGLIRPAGYNRNLQWLVEKIDPSGNVSSVHYQEVDIAGDGRPMLVDPQDDRSEEVEKVAGRKTEFALDAASVIVTDSQGQRWRLPKGAPEYDGLLGKLRTVREVASERFLANLHGTFYEVPRDPQNRPDWCKMKPVSSHRKWIADYCSWRGLLVLCGVRDGASEDRHVLGKTAGPGLWFGALDDLWKLGPPRGEGGPWLETPVQADQTSDPYLMTGYDRKTLRLRHDADQPVRFTLEVDFDHNGFHPYLEIVVPPKQTVEHVFPIGFHAHWVRLKTNHDCRATASLQYE